MFYGWKIVAVAFLIASFAWGLGFYSLGIYLVALHEIHGWSIGFISTAITVFYFTGAAFTVFTGDLVERFGPRRTVIFGACAMAAGVFVLTLIDRPWQIFPAFGLMAAGWATTSGAAINTILAPWFERRRGLAINLALNGSSVGGIVFVPVWTVLIAGLGFAVAAPVVLVVSLLVLLPPVVIYLHRRPADLGLSPDGRSAAAPDPPSAGAGIAPPAAPVRRAELLRSGRFWTISVPFALALFAQVSFLVHQIAYLTPTLGPEGAALAVVLTTATAILGRLLSGALIDRANRRLAASLNFLFQALALAVMVRWPSVAVLYIGCAVFGLGIGNLITLPGLIVQREFPRRHFARVVSLVTAINQFVFSFGPGVIGWLRDATGAYTGPFALCVAFYLIAAAVVLTGVRRHVPS